jgi:hypothetical protein
MIYLKKFNESRRTNWGKMYSDLVIGISEQIKLENDLDETLEDFKDLITDLSDYGSRTKIDNYLVIDSKIGRPNQPRKASGLKKLRIEEKEYTDAMYAAGVYNHWIEASTSINKLLKFKQDLYWQIETSIKESCKIGRVNKEIKKEFKELKLNLESRGWQIVGQQTLSEPFIIDSFGTFGFDVRIKVDYNNLNEWILENCPEILK